MSGVSQLSVFSSRALGAALQDFRNLKVWEKSHKLTLEAYRISGHFPRSETYGLTSQFRRAAASIPANIAEGCGRNSSAELARFLEIALGSASELEYHLLLAHDLAYIDDKNYTSVNAQVVQVKKMLAPLIKSLRVTRKRS